MPAQIITFTFPHIGNVGANHEDIETTTPAARGLVAAQRRSPSRPITAPTQSLDTWLKSHGIVGLCGVDTRRLTRLIRDRGPPNGVIAYHPDGAARSRGAARGRRWPGPGSKAWISPREVTCRQSYEWRRDGVGGASAATAGRRRRASTSSPSITAPSATSCGCSPRMAAGSRSSRRPPRPRTSCAIEPDGIFLSNGPGDPAATGEYAVPVLRELIDSGQADLRHLPRPSAAGAGARRPRPARWTRAIAAPTTRSATASPARSRSPARTTALSSIRRACRPGSSRPTSRCSTAPTRGCGSNGKPVFSVQHHPEASPGPQDSHYLFERFVDLMASERGRSEMSRLAPFESSRRSGSTHPHAAVIGTPHGIRHDGPGIPGRHGRMPKRTDITAS